MACQAHPVLVFSYMFRALSHNSVRVDYEKLYTLNGLKGSFIQSAPADSGFAGDPTPPGMSRAREAASPSKAATRVQTRDTYCPLAR